VKNLIRSLIRETLLLEEVYGAQAVVYHGTKADPLTLIDALLKDKFTPGVGAGAMYGKGLYTVYDPNEARTMEGYYGDHVIKLKVNLYGYIIFDPDVALRVYKRPLTPVEQAKEIGYSKKIIEHLRSATAPLVGRWADSSAKPSVYTSEIALKVFSALEGKVKGLVFTGRNDGRVAVVYDPSTAVPMAWKRVDAESWNPVDRKTLLSPVARFDDERDHKSSRVQSPIGRSALGGWESNKYQTLERMKRMPVDRRVIEGNLDAQDYPETTQFPEGLHVKGTLILTSKIKSLPLGLVIDGDLLGGDGLESLPPDIRVGRNIDIAGSKISELPANLRIRGVLSAEDSMIRSLPPTIQVFGGIYLTNTPIETIPADLDIYGDLDLSDCDQLKSLPQGLDVPGDLDVSRSSLTELPDNMTVGGQLSLSKSITRIPRNLTVKKSLFVTSSVKELPEDLKVRFNIVGFEGDPSRVPPELRIKLS